MLIPVFLALGIEVHTAMATALLLNAIAMSVASVNFVRKRLVVWKVALPMVVVASALSPLGAWVSQRLDRTVLLWLFVGFPKKASASTSFVVIFSSLTGFLGHLPLAGMSYTLLGWTAGASAAGAILGSWLMTDKLKGRQVKLLIGVVLLGVAAKMAWGLG